MGKTQTKQPTYKLNLDLIHVEKEFKARCYQAILAQNTCKIRDSEHFTEAIFNKRESQAHSLLERSITLPISKRTGQITRTLQTFEANPVNLEDHYLLPYSSILRLEAKFGDSIYGGSATIIGSCYALTAKHVIFDENCEQWADSIKAIPAQYKNDEPFGHAFARKAYIFKDCDMALIVLDEHLANKTGHLKIGVINSAELINSKITVCGYPLLKDGNDTMYTHEGEFCEFHVSDYSLGYSTQTWEGQSGSPVLVKNSEDGEYFLIGIHNKSGPITRNIGYGTMINRDRLHKIETLITESNQQEPDNVKGIDFQECKREPCEE